ncbi:hypothetical protein ACWEQL_00610 [Kitasatospora sp. NPDC004240]
MLVPDLSRLLREATPAQLVAAVKAAVDAAGWYAPAPKPDYGDTELTIACAEAKADVARDVADAVVLALSAAAPTSGQPS